jgi:hypothetical protein
MASGISAALYNGSTALLTAQLNNELCTIKASELKAIAMLANADNQANQPLALLGDWH